MKVFKIKKLWNELFVAMREREFEKDLEQTDFYLFDKTEKGEIDRDKMVGYFMLVRNKKRAQLAEGYLLKSYRNQKIGQKMLDIRTEYASVKGCNKLFVTLLNDDNIGKRRQFFVRNGFEFPDTMGYKEFEFLSTMGDKEIEPKKQREHLPDFKKTVEIEFDADKVREQMIDIHQAYALEKYEK